MVGKYKKGYSFSPPKEKRRKKNPCGTISLPLRSAGVNWISLFRSAHHHRLSLGMAHSCVSSSLRFSSSSLSLSSPNPSSSPLSSSKTLSFPLNKSGLKSSAVKAVYAPGFSAPGRSSGGGIWSIRYGFQRMS